MGEFIEREEFSVTRERGNLSLLREQTERWRRRGEQGDHHALSSLRCCPEQREGESLRIRMGGG